MTDMKAAIAAFRDGCGGTVGLTDAEIGAGLDRAAPHLVPRGVMVDAGLRERMVKEAGAKASWIEAIDAVLALVPTPPAGRHVVMDEFGDLIIAGQQMLQWFGRPKRDEWLNDDAWSMAKGACANMRAALTAALAVQPAEGAHNPADVRRLVEAARDVLAGRATRLTDALRPFGDQPKPAPQAPKYVANPHDPDAPSWDSAEFDTYLRKPTPPPPATLETLARGVAEQAKLWAFGKEIRAFMLALADHQREEAARRERQRAAWKAVENAMTEWRESLSAMPAQQPTRENGYSATRALAALAKEMQG